MSFLSQKGILHRDLAARNILVNQSMQIKISDFGMAKDVRYSNTYHKKDEEMVPVKWMAIEALHIGAFSSKRYRKIEFLIFFLLALDISKCSVNNEECA